MPKQLTKEQSRLTEKQERFSINMFTYGLETFSNGTASARKAGYKGTDNYLARVASENVRNCKILARKEEIQKDVRVKLEHNADKALEMLHETYDIARRQSNPAAMTGVIRELDDITGLKQQQDNRQAVSITIAAPEPRDTQTLEQPVINLTGLEQPASGHVAITAPESHLSPSDTQLVNDIAGDKDIRYATEQPTINAEALKPNTTPTQPLSNTEDGSGCQTC